MTPQHVGDRFRWHGRALFLLARPVILRAIREFLDGNGFLEVASPIVVKGACPDVHLDSMTLSSGEVLITSSEYQLKRLIVGGFERVYSMAQNFRQGDLGDRHNPEFTMLEWARAWDSLDSIEHDAERLVSNALLALHGPEATCCSWNGHCVRLRGEPWERLTVREALKRYLGIEVPADLHGLAQVARAAQEAGIAIPGGLAHEEPTVWSWVLDQVTPHLGLRVPTFLREWPAFMTSSTAPGGGVAVRSELIVAGLELADGFPFLRDAALQRQLFDRENDARRCQGKPEAPVDEAYLRALEEGIAPGAGMALGIDRLVMLLTGAKTLRDVLPFGWDER
jgi:lysyl-tRNA synthetase class 2